MRYSTPLLLFFYDGKLKAIVISEYNQIVLDQILSLHNGSRNHVSNDTPNHTLRYHNCYAIHNINIMHTHIKAEKRWIKKRVPLASKDG